MPCRKTEGAFGLSRISTMQKRASYCSLAFRWKLGQVSAPGTRDLRRLRNWQPLHTPNEKVLGLMKKSVNCCRIPLWSSTDFAQPWPAPNTSPVRLQSQYCHIRRDRRDTVVQNDSEKAQRSRPEWRNVGTQRAYHRRSHHKLQGQRISPA